jgi:hypothetical protein
MPRTLTCRQKRKLLIRPIAAHYKYNLISISAVKISQGILAFRFEMSKVNF